MAFLRQKVDGRQNIQPTHRTLAQLQFNLRAVASSSDSQKPHSDPLPAETIPRKVGEVTPELRDNATETTRMRISDIQVGL